MYYIHKPAKIKTTFLNINIKREKEKNMNTCDSMVNLLKLIEAEVWLL